jgi:outer membrane protein assembly factor BamB
MGAPMRVHDCQALKGRGAFGTLGNMRAVHALSGTAILIFTMAQPACARDRPQWGEAWSRNMVSKETDLPASFDRQSGQNVKWAVPLGTETHSTPVVAGGRVYIGTNNGEPRDPKHEGDRGVLMCFDERTGKLLWQLVVPKREEDRYFDWPKCGISSPVTVEGDRVYLVSNRGEVMCLDARGLANGNDGPYRDEGAHMTPTNQTAMTAGPLDADIIWLFDLTSGAGIWSHDAAHSSVLIRGDHLYLNTGTGVDNTHKKIRTPDAPSLVVLDKHSGRYLAREREGMAPNIFHCTWSAPSMGVVSGKPLIFFAGGNGFVYAFEPLGRMSPTGATETLHRIWQFDFDPTAPKKDVHRYNQNRREGPSNFYGMPVFDDGHVYVAGGGDLFWGKNEAWLKCINADNGAAVWSYSLEKHVFSTPAVHDGLVFIADCGRKMHCVDAKTGAGVWTHAIKGEVWASPLVADDKVYLGTREGEFYVFAASRDGKLLHQTNLGDKISATATAANGVLYVATMSQLFALKLQLLARDQPDYGVRRR